MASPAPSYYPEGWDRERMLNSAATGEIRSLTEEQLEVFRTGLKADLGPQGFDDFTAEIYKRELKSKGQEPPKWESELPRQIPKDWNPWGLVVYKSPEIRDAGRWQACRRRFDQIILDSISGYRAQHDPSDQAVGAAVDPLEECLSRMKFQWIEDVGDADGSIASIGQAYLNLEPPVGLNHSICLYITPASLESILDTPLPATANRRYRTAIPFVVAVSPGDVTKTPEQIQELIEEDAAGADWRGYFNVAVETLLDCVFPTLANGRRSPFEFAGHVQGEDIYCDHTRFGVHKAGVGFYDRRARRWVEGIESQAV
ncbi:hypothetical protein F4780DRAFT_507972 [Xylariomycetidae sp. FL0641]|nr:hypothetical protein F4780DRAFT_507972 [Xylariomycetidae sp. FL0641]